jgi:seryl-tRNA synthetase
MHTPLLEQLPPINYARITHALDYYSAHGFVYKETPWVVSRKASEVTKPPDAENFSTLGGYLVASGEQGFIEQLLQGEPLSRHVTVTPCFRNEPTIDDIHYHYFLKVELIDLNADKENLLRMLDTAQKFFENYRHVSVLQTDTLGETFDIIDTETSIELGSYGIRRIDGVPPFIYGTGLAEPRFSVVCSY